MDKELRDLCVSAQVYLGRRRELDERFRRVLTGYLESGRGKAAEMARELGVSVSRWATGIHEPSGLVARLAEAGEALVAGRPGMVQAQRLAAQHGVPQRVAEVERGAIGKEWRARVMEVAWRLYAADEADEIGRSAGVRGGTREKYAPAWAGVQLPDVLRHMGIPYTPAVLGRSPQARAARKAAGAPGSRPAKEPGNQVAANRVAQALRLEGWERRQQRRGDRQEWRWRPAPRTYRCLGCDAAAVAAGTDRPAAMTRDEFADHKHCLRCGKLMTARQIRRHRCGYPDRGTAAPGGIAGAGPAGPA